MSNRPTKHHQQPPPTPETKNPPPQTTAAQHQHYRRLQVKAIEEQHQPPSLDFLLHSLATFKAPKPTLIALRSIIACINKGNHIRIGGNSDALQSHYHKIQQLQRRHAANLDRMAALPSQIDTQWNTCQALLSKRQEATSNIAMMMDDIALMNAEKEHGTSEIAVMHQQRKTSDTHKRVDTLKEMTTELRRDIRAMENNHRDYGKQRVSNEGSKVKKSSLYKALEPMMLLQDDQKRLMARHQVLQKEFVASGEDAYALSVQMRQEKKCIEQLNQKINRILMKCDERPNWTTVVARIGNYELEKSLKLGLHAGGGLLDSGVVAQKSTSDNVNTLVEIYQQTLFDTVGVEDATAGTVQLPRIESVTTARLQEVLKEYDVLFTLLQQKIRELPYKWHVVDRAIDNWQHQTFKRFAGLGDSSDVPLWLRCQKGALFDRRLHDWDHNRVRQVVEDVWDKYLEERRRVLGGEEEPAPAPEPHAHGHGTSSSSSIPPPATITLSSFMYKYAQLHSCSAAFKASKPSKHMLNKKRMTWSINFMHALRHYSVSGDAVCAISDLILNLHWCSDYYLYMMKLIEQMHVAIDNACGIKDQERKQRQQDAWIKIRDEECAEDTTLSVMAFENIVHQVCPFLNENEVGRLVDAARRDSILIEHAVLGKGKEVGNELLVHHLLALGHRGDIPGASYGAYTPALSKSLDQQCRERWPNHGVDLEQYKVAPSEETSETTPKDVQPSDVQPSDVQPAVNFKMGAAELKDNEPQRVVPAQKNKTTPVVVVRPVPASSSKKNKHTLKQQKQGKAAKKSKKKSKQKGKGRGDGGKDANKNDDEEETAAQAAAAAALEKEEKAKLLRKGQQQHQTRHVTKHHDHHEKNYGFVASLCT
mgnify:CR=1 FL=1